MMINTAIGNEHVLSAILSVKETLENRLASV